MSTNEVFLSLFIVLVTLLIASGALFKYYFDAKLDPVQAQIRQLLDHMISQHGRIAALEERTKNL